MLKRSVESGAAQAFLGLRPRAPTLLVEKSLEGSCTVKTLELEITTHDRDLLRDLVDADKVRADEPMEIAEGVSLTYQGSKRFKSVGEPEIIMLAITFGTSVSARLLATWLWSKLHNRENTSLTIDRIEVEIDEGKITRIIREKIEKR